MASSKEYVLVTGGAGYIGSHTVCQLLEKGHNVLIVDNLDNSSLVAVERVREIAKLRLESGDVELIMKVTDLLDKSSLEAIFQQYAFTSCIHFAGLKAVGESVRLPMQYYHNNLTGTLHLVELLSKYGCKTIVFSSSATVYGQPEKVPATEDLSLGATNPYGRTKLYIEQILRDVYASDSSWSIALLRYFNPVGAHPSGLIGEDPKGIPNNLMPFVQQVAVGRRECLSVFGDDYPTKDGTGVRDYIHVMDLADGHIAALDTMLKLKTDFGCRAINLGTGKGTSVLEIVEAFRAASGQAIPIKIVSRRAGDVAEVYGATDKAREELGWVAKRGIEEMCRDQWNWASKNPDGYEG